MTAQRVCNIGTTKSRSTLSKQINLEIFWPIEDSDMNDPLSKPFSLRYNDGTSPNNKDWIEIGRYMSLSGAQKDADALIGTEIPGNQWQSAAK